MSAEARPHDVASVTPASGLAPVVGEPTLRAALDDFLLSEGDAARVLDEAAALDRRRSVARRAAENAALSDAIAECKEELPKGSRRPRRPAGPSERVEYHPAAPVPQGARRDTLEVEPRVRLAPEVDPRRQPTAPSARVVAASGVETAESIGEGFGTDPNEAEPVRRRRRLGVAALATASVLAIGAAVLQLAAGAPVPAAATSFGARIAGIGATFATVAGTQPAPTAAEAEATEATESDRAAQDEKKAPPPEAQTTRPRPRARAAAAREHTHDVPAEPATTTSPARASEAPSPDLIYRRTEP